MKNNSLKSLAIVLGILVVLAGLFSFAPTPGGDYFTISLNKKLVLEQFVHRDKTVRTVQLTESNMNDELAIIYSHCGVIGTARNIEIRDSKDNVVKQLHFPDAVESSGNSMIVKVKDILALKKNGERATYKVVYSSKLAKEGMTLASLSVSSDSKASLD